MGEFGTFDMQMLGITSDQIKKVDASDADVVSRVLMSRIKDIVVTIRPDGLIFNATCIRCFIDVYYIRLMIDRSIHRLYVAPANEFHRNSYRWCNEKNGKRISRKITGKEFGDRVYSMMKWSKGYTYRVTGYPAQQAGEDGEYLLAFDLDEDADHQLLTEKGLIAARVYDEDLGADAEKIHAEIAKEKEEKEKAKAEAAATGKKKRARQKIGYNKTIESGAFGVPRKEHVDQLIIPTLEQLEILGPST